MRVSKDEARVMTQAIESRQVLAMKLEEAIEMLEGVKDELLATGYVQFMHHLLEAGEMVQHVAARTSRLEWAGEMPLLDEERPT